MVLKKIPRKLDAKWLLKIYNKLILESKNPSKRR